MGVDGQWRIVGYDRGAAVAQTILPTSNGGRNAQHRLGCAQRIVERTMEWRTVAWYGVGAVCAGELVREFDPVEWADARGFGL